MLQLQLPRTLYSMLLRKPLLLCSQFSFLRSARDISLFESTTTACRYGTCESVTDVDSVCAPLYSLRAGAAWNGMIYSPVFLRISVELYCNALGPPYHVYMYMFT